MRIARRSRNRRARRPASPPGRARVTGNATHRKSTQAASKSAESKKAAEKQVADASGDTAPAMPASVANANAQTDGRRCAARQRQGHVGGMSEKANTVLQAAADKPADAEAPAEPGVVASDQLNDVDRSLPLPNSQRRRPRRRLQWPRPPDRRRMRHRNDSSTLGPDLADRKDLHRLRRVADDGLGRAHVHGVTSAGHRTRRPRRVSAACAHLKPIPAAGTLPAKSGSRGGSWRRSNTSLSRARARSASSR